MKGFLERVVAILVGLIFFWAAYWMYQNKVYDALNGFHLEVVAFIFGTICLIFAVVGPQLLEALDDED